jgi:hypothetical protein
VEPTDEAVGLSGRRCIGRSRGASV